MARKAPSTPPLRLHKASGQAYVNLDGRRVYLGKHDSPATQQAYLRTVGEWLANGRRAPLAAEDITIAELADRYLEHAEVYYRLLDGSPSSELSSVRLAVKALVTLYGDIPAAQFGPLKLQAVRQQWIEKGLCRSTINTHLMGALKRMFVWATAQELVPAQVHTALSTVKGLRKGRSAAKEPRVVSAVAQAHIDAIQPFVSRQVWGLIRLQLLTGARSGEVLKLRRIDLDTSGNIWTTRIAHHKTSHRGKERTLYFGERAQAVLREYFPGKGPTDYLFSPADAERERLAKRHEARVTPTVMRQSARGKAVSC